MTCSDLHTIFVFKKSMLENNNILVFSLCLDYVNYYFWTALYTQLLCVRASFFAASEASRKASHVCFLFFSTWGFSFKIYELKKASERRHSQNTDRIQVANSRPPGTRAKREEGQVYCYLTRKIDGKIAYLFSLLLLLILVAFIFLSKLYLKIFLDPPPPLMKKVFSWQSKKKYCWKKKN